MPDCEQWLRFNSGDQQQVSVLPPSNCPSFVGDSTGRPGVKTVVLAEFSHLGENRQLRKNQLPWY